MNISGRYYVCIVKNPGFINPNSRLDFKMFHTSLTEEKLLILFFFSSYADWIPEYLALQRSLRLCNCQTKKLQPCFPKKKVDQRPCIKSKYKCFSQFAEGLNFLQNWENDRDIFQKLIEIFGTKYCNNLINLMQYMYIYVHAVMQPELKIQIN